MRVPARYDVGAATHTGLRRAANEDDYLLLSPPGGGLIAIIADGMGGAAGGAEASRAAVRAFASAVLDGTTHQDAKARLVHGFAAACARVHEQAQEVPSLRDMGTTLTAVEFVDDHAVIGHVGDTRAMLLSGNTLMQLTTDHAVREPDNVLTRCIGGGQATEVPDITTGELTTGTVLALVSDGVWSAIADTALGEALTRQPAQAAAERLVQLALAAGGPDNATAVVVRVTGKSDGEHEVALPHEESSRTGGLRATSLRQRWWPWLVLGVALVVAVVSLLKMWLPGVFGGVL